MQGAFIQALTYSPPTVLGRQLAPLSSWHILLLEAAGSPYIVGGHPQVDDLLTGIWICSHGFADGLAVAGDAEALCLWGKSVTSHSYTPALAAFAEYIRASFAVPEYWTDGKDGGSLRAPYCWHMATFAMRDLHLPEAQAWDFPIARLACYQACVGEINGNKDLMSADEIKGEEVLKADAEKEKAEKGKQ